MKDGLCESPDIPGAEIQNSCMWETTQKMLRGFHLSLSVGHLFLVCLPSEREAFGNGTFFRLPVPGNPRAAP